MNVEELREYCLSPGDVEEKFTWVAVRSTEDEMEEIALNHSAVLPGRKNMRLWLNVALGGDITDSMISELVSRAYDIIKDKYSYNIKKK